jgi:hypothetical protein
MNFVAFAEQVHLVIKKNSAAQVIQSPEAIAEEALSHNQHHASQQHGIGVFRALWKEHRNKTDMVIYMLV